MLFARSRPKKNPRILATSVAALLSLAAAALGDSATWSGPGNAWTDNVNWNNTPFPNSSTDIATFDATGTSFTPTIDSTMSITVGEISFSVGAAVYTVTLDGTAGSTSLTMAGVGVTNNSGLTQNFTATGGGGNTATFFFENGATAGVMTAYTLNDGGVMQFNSSSTAGGSTVTIQNGGKVYFAGNSQGGTAAVTNNAGGIFDISAQSGGVSVGSIAGGGNFFLGANTLTTGSDNTSTTVSGVIQDGGISGGTGGGLTKTGTGTLTLSGANTYTGATTISDGTIMLTGSLSTVTAVNVSGATGVFDISGIVAASQTIGSLAGVAGSSVNLGAKNLTVGTNNASTTFAGVMSGAGGTLTKIGSGNLTLSGGNTYTGGTTLSGGGLFVGDNNALGTGALTIAANDTVLKGTVDAIVLPNAISVQANFYAGTDFSDLTFNGAVDLNGATREITGFNPSNQIHFAGPINNGGLTLSTTFNITGQYVAFILDAGNVNTYTGLTTINTGAFLVLRGTTPNGAIHGDVLIQGNGVLDYLSGASEQVLDTATVTVNSPGNTANFQQFTGLDLYSAGMNNVETIGTLNGNVNGVVGLANATLSVGAGTFAGQIIDGFHGLTGGNLTKYGPGTLTLSGANTYTGATTVSGGKLVITGDGSLGDLTSVNLTAGTVIVDVSGRSAPSDTIGSLAGVAGSSVVLGNNNLTAGANNSNTTFAGVLSGAGGSFTKTGTGTMTLTGVNTYTGTTAANGGTLVADVTVNPMALSSASALAVGGGTFQLSNTSANPRTQIMDGLTVNPGGSSIVINNAGGGTTTLDMRGVSGTQGITRLPGGSVDFRASAGTFSVDARVLTAQANDPTGIIGTWATVNGGTGFAAVDANGVIVAYNGYTDINALGPNTVPNDPNANVRINAMGTAGPVPISAPTTNINTLTQNYAPTASTIDTSPGVLRVGVEGGIIITSGSAALTIGTAPNSGKLTAGGSADNVAGELTLNNMSANTLTINSVIADNGTGVVGVTKIGSGLVVLAGTNTYSGPTTIGTGTLSLVGAGSLLDAGAVNLTGPTAVFDITQITAASETIGSLAGVANSSVTLGAKNLTIAGDGTNTTFAGVISGATGSITKSGTGSLGLSGNNTYTGGTTLAGGTLITDSNNALGTGGLTITATGTGTTLGSTVEGIVLPNAVSVLGNFSIGTTAFNYTLGGVVNLNGATRTITGFNSTNQIHFSNAITNGGLTLTTTLSGTGNYVAFILDAGNVNTYTGLTTIDNGAFLVLQGQTANGAIQGNVLIQGNGVLDYLGGNSEQIANNATVTVNSNGNNANGEKFTGFDLFQTGGGTETIAVLNGTGTVGLSNSTLALSSGTFSGSISDGFHAGFTGGNLTKNGPGTLTLSGVNSYTGATTITDGKIVLTGGGLLGDKTAMNLTTATAVFDLSGITATGDTIGSLNGAAGSSVVLGAKNLTAGGNNGSTTFAGVLSGAGGSFTKEGTGTMNLTGVNTYTGPTTVNGGTLNVDVTTNPTALSSASALVVGGGIFQLTNNSGTPRVQIMNGLTVNTGSSAIVINNAGGSTTTLDLRGPSGTQGIVHNPGGTVDFRASSGTFATNALVYTGQQNDVNTGFLGAYATVNNGAAFAMNDGTGLIVAYNGYVDIAAQGPPPNSVIPNSQFANVRINSPGTSGPVTLAAPVTVINTLTQNNTQASTVDLAGQTLRLGTAGGIFITPNSGATGSLTIGAAPNSGTVTAGTTPDVAAELILGNFNTNTNATLTINSAITNNGVGVVSVTKTGNGLVVLAGDNSYRGVTLIGAGTLALANAGSIADTGAVNLTGATAKFDISGITGLSETIGSLEGANGSMVNLGAKNLTVGGNGANTVFSGVLADGGIVAGAGGSLTKVGSGTMTLTGANTYTGLTRVDGGALVLNTTGANAISGNVLVSAGTLILQQSNQILDSRSVRVDGGSFNLGANSETVAGVILAGGSIDGTTGILTSGSTFDVRSGTVTANLNSTSNTVGLDKTTAGTVILAGNNTYRGPTNVNGGILVLEGSINYGLNGVNVNNGSEFDVTENGIVVVGDNVPVVKASDGNTVNNAGLLQGGNNSTGILAATNNQITNSGAIVGGAVGFTGVGLTGSGNFLNNSGFISGNKAVVLTNGSGSNGVVNYGTLNGVSGIAIDALASGGDLTVTNVGEIDGDIRFGPGNDIMTLVAGSPVNGIIDGGTGTNQLRLVGSGNDSLELGSGYVTNFTTLYKGGGGTWTLNGEGTFPGGTTVNMGKLYVQGNLISDVLVEQMGFLGGVGTITGRLTNLGTVSPGNSPGILTVKGDYVQGKSGNLIIQIQGKKAGQYDVLKVGGTAQLAGTLTIQKVKEGPKFKIGEKVTFLTADGGVDGKFSKVVNSLNSNTIIQTNVVYDSNSVSLEASQGSYEDYARLHKLTPNQRATARVVDAAASSGKNDKMIEYLNSHPVDKIPGELDRIAPEELAAVYRVGVGLANVQSQNIQRRTEDLRLTNRRVSTDGFQATGAGPSYSGQLGAAGATGPDGQDGKVVRPPDRRWGAFLSGMGEWIRIGDTENARGYDFTTGGVTVGADYRANDHLAVGVSVGYAGTDASLVQGGKLSVNSGKVGAYATYYDGGYYVNAAVSGGYNSYESQRSGLQGMARGKTDGGEFNAMIGGGYDWTLESLTLGALTSVEYTYLGLGGFSEHGSLAPLDVSSQNGQSLRSKLGFKAVYDWQLGGVLLRPEFRAVWQHEYGDRSFAVDSQLASGAGGVFTVHDSEVGRDSLLLGVGASMILGPRTATYLFYDGEIYRKESETHNVTGGVRISF